MGWRIRAGKAFAFAVIMAVYLVGFQIITPIALSDPDRYLHLSIARQTANEGMVQSLPQADNLDWKHKFPHPYPTFELLNGLLYRLGGRSAVELSVPVFGLGFFGVLFLLLSRLTSLPNALILALGALVSVGFSSRMMLLRPHVPGLSLFLILVYGAVIRHAGTLAVASMVFALSYHAIYIPGAVLGIAGALEFARKSPDFRPMLFGIAGLVAGLLLHPGFPANIEMMFLTATNAANISRIEEILRPIENHAMTPRLALELFAGYFLAIVAIGATLVDVRNRREALNALRERLGDPSTFLFFTAIAFWVLAFVSRRATEYAVPLTLLAVAAHLGKRPNRAWSWVIASVLAVTQVPGAVFQYQWGRPMIDSKALIESVRSLPEEGSGKKVLNCEWDAAPFILYERPAYRFVDLADPVVLAQQAPLLFQLRELLRRGLSPYPYGIARHAFNADYVLCDHPAGIEQLERDPHFIRRHPARFQSMSTRSPGAAYVYETNPSAVVHDVVGFQIRSTPSAKWEDLVFAESGLPAEQRSPFIDLRRWRAENVSKEKSRDGCVALRPTPDEIKKHRGADMLAIGGGYRIRLWFGDRAVFDGTLPGPPHLAKHWVILPEKVKSTTSIQAIVCERSEDPFYGFSLSLWKNEDLPAQAVARTVAGK